VLSIPELKVGKVTETKEAMPLLNEKGLVENPEATEEKTVQ
jgi:hypothetical protein